MYDKTLKDLQQLSILYQQGPLEIGVTYYPVSSFFIFYFKEYQIDINTGSTKSLFFTIIDHDK